VLPDDPGWANRLRLFWANASLCCHYSVSQAPSDIGREDGTDGDAWQGLKAPTVHHDQRSKFRQQTAPYIRPN
jgi:hypothetical protein